MTRKHTIQMPIESDNRIIVKKYLAGYHSYLLENMSVSGNVIANGNKYIGIEQKRLIILSFYTLRTLIGFFGRLLNWLNGFGISKIDLHRTEGRYNQPLGMRRWNL